MIFFVLINTKLKLFKTKKYYYIYRYNMNIYNKYYNRLPVINITNNTFMNFDFITKDNLQCFLNKDVIYRVRAKNSILECYGKVDETLVQIAKELVEIINENITLDAFKREDARARIRNNIRKLLIKYNYPPNKSVEAVNKVLKQAELKYSEN